jgi:hypothetical protein
MHRGSTEHSNYRRVESMRIGSHHDGSLEAEAIDKQTSRNASLESGEWRLPFELSPRYLTVASPPTLSALDFALQPVQLLIHADPAQDLIP